MEKKAIIQYKKRFDDIRHEENGIEFWYARELMELLEYAQWRNFEKTIEKAKTSCENNGITVTDHFADVSKMIKIGKGGNREDDDYMEEVDYVKEINNEKEKLISKRDLIESISLSRVKLSELIDADVLDKNNLQIQPYIHIDNGTPYIESFIVGRGIFFSVYDDGYAFDELRIENKDLIIPTYDYEEDDPNKNYGHDPGLRDYREYSCLENILYLITHKDVEDAGVNLMSCNAPGISFYISQAEVIKLLNPNMYRDIVLIDGDMDFAYSKTITKDSFIE